MKKSEFSEILKREINFFIVKATASSKFATEYTVANYSTFQGYTVIVGNGGSKYSEEMLLSLIQQIEEKKLNPYYK